MKEQKGAGLIIAFITVFLVALIFWGLLAKPKGDDVPVDGYDPNKSILEQSGDLVDQAKEVRDDIESKNNVEDLQ